MSFENLNQNVALYSRLAVFSFYAFVECFINSVGEDAILRNSALASEQQQTLRGFNKKGGFISLEKKIEKFPGIIRGDGKCPLVLSDPAQRVEPFITFMGEVKSARDAFAHYGKRKADLLRNPRQWVEIANTACDICIDVARQFWSACYPSRPQPLYLGRLDKDLHTKIATERVKAEDSCIEQRQAGKLDADQKLNR